MGLVAGVSVFSIIELIFTVLKCARLVFCKTKVHPIIMVHPKTQSPKLALNQQHLFYHFGMNFVGFLEKTSIHGMHYLKDKRLRWVEKTFWIIAIFSSTVVCTFLIVDSLEALHTKAVIISYDEKIYSKEDIPFPVISFCPDSDAALLTRHFYCLWVDECDGLNKSDLLAMMATLKSVSSYCSSNWLPLFENTFGPELEKSSFPNMTAADHLEYFTDQNWTQQNSFCLDSRAEFKKTTPWVAVQSGLCFILNPEQNDHSAQQ